MTHASRFVAIFLLVAIPRLIEASEFLPRSGIGPKKILFLLPEKTPSHQNVFSALITALLERGHHVTMVSAGAQKTKHPNLREIHTEDPFGIIPDMSPEFFKGPKNIFMSLLMMLKLGPLFTKVIFENPEALALKNEKFDLVVTEAFFFQEPLLAFAHHFRCPNMILYCVGYSINMNFFTGGAVNPAYVPNTFGTGLESENFLDRFKNTMTTVAWLLGHQFYYLPKANARMHEIFPDAPPIHDLLRNISLTLVNNNNALMAAVPLAPSVIEVAGLFIKPGGPLPPDLKKWIEDSDGIVYFSLGSNLQANLLPQDKQDSIFASFRKLKQRVLIKWNGDTPANAPRNCRFEKWVPQQEVLAHPKLKVFVSHGGLLSTQESVYYGAALIGMPVYGDQHTNIALATKRGFAVGVSIFDLTTEVFDAALKEVINNPRYREKSKELSTRFRLDPMPPLDKAVYYTEQLIRLGSLEHLQPSSVKLRWYQYMLLDILAATAIVLYITYIIIRRVFSTLSNCCRRTSKSKQD